MRSTVPENLQEIAVPIVERNNAFVVDIVVRGERSSKVIEVFVESDSGISLEQCSTISRELSAALDVADIIQGRYRLDVSSPDLKKPLKLFRQYKKNVGRTCKVHWLKDGVKVIQEGILEEVKEHSILVSKAEQKTEIAFTAITETYIIPQIKKF